MFALIGAAAFLPACSQRRESCAMRPAGPPLVVVVAPVVNLSNTQQVDSLQITDAIASELVTFPNIRVIPVDLALAALGQRGKSRIETAEDAHALAHEFAADATVVAALTEFDPYDPPRCGLVMQWYGARPAAEDGGAARAEARIALAPAAGPAAQIQRVFSADDEQLLSEIRDYGAEREGHASPYAWRRYVTSQRLFMRYCCRAMIESMLTQVRGYPTLAADAEADE
jgi:hypothetical protein